MAVDLNTVAEDMFEMVKEVQGQKKYKPGDCFKAMMKKYADQEISKKDCKAALRILIDGERLIYTYANGSWVELPGKDPAALAAEEAAQKS